MKNIFEIIAESDWNKQVELEKKLLEHENKLMVFPKKFRLTPETVLQLVKQKNKIVTSPYINGYEMYVCDKEFKKVNLGCSLVSDETIPSKFHNAWLYSHLITKPDEGFFAIKGITVT